MIVMKKVSVVYLEARRNISKELNENENNFCDYAHGDLIMRAIRFIIDPRYEFRDEVNELWMNYSGIKSVVIVFKNTGNEPRKFWIGETVTVIRKVSNHLKTLEWNNKRIKVKTFYNIIHQDYEPEGDPISRPYIITGRDAGDFKSLSEAGLFKFVDSAVTLNQHLKMREEHDVFMKRMVTKLDRNSKIIHNPKKRAQLRALSAKFDKLTNECKENHMLSTANKDTMDKKLFLDLKASLHKAEKWFQTLIESNGLLDGFKLKFFLIVEDENCTKNELLQMNALKKLSFSIYDSAGNRFDTRTSIQVNNFVYISLCLGLMEQVGFPYCLISIDDFCGGLHQKIQEILVGMNTNVQFVILEN